MRYVYTTRAQVARVTDHAQEIAERFALDAETARNRAAVLCGYADWAHVQACLEVAPLPPTRLPDRIEQTLARALEREQARSCSGQAAAKIKADIAISTFVSFDTDRQPAIWPTGTLDETTISHPWGFLAEAVLRPFLLLIYYEEPLETANLSEDDLLDLGYDFCNDLKWLRVASPHRPNDGKSLLTSFRRIGIPEPKAILLRGKFLEPCSMPDIVDGHEVIHAYDSARDWRNVRYGGWRADLSKTH